MGLLKAGAGSAVATTLVTKVLPAAIGLAKVGPTAGGVFAAAQSTGAVTAGSSWALTQSLVMKGAVSTIGGPVAFASFSCFAAYYFLTRKHKL